MTTSSRDATDAIRTQNHDALSALPFSDTQDFDDANRGLIAPIEEPVLAPDGTVLWDNSTYDFLEGEAPDTVHPSLWRQRTLPPCSGSRACSIPATRTSPSSPPSRLPVDPPGGQKCDRGRCKVALAQF